MNAHSLYRAADVIHLLAAATSLGALVALLAGVITHTEAPELARCLAGFAMTGAAVVLVLLATGIANAVLTAGWPPPWGGLWSLLLGVKLVRIAGMLGLTALNRWQSTPLLTVQGDSGIRGLRLSPAIETTARSAIVAVISVLGVLHPAA